MADFICRYLFVTKKYLIGIFISLVLIIGNQVFIQYWLGQKTDDAKIINLAGKQRMLSQRINFEVCRYDKSIAAKNRLDLIVLEWENAHKTLLNGNPSLGIEAIKAAEPRKNLNQLTQQIIFLKERISEADWNIAEITANQDRFLVLMNKTVQLLEEESERKLSFIVIMEISLMILTLVVLAFEVRYIFYPAIHQLKKHQKVIEEQNNVLKQQLRVISNKTKHIEEFSFVTAHHLNESVRKINTHCSMFEDDYKDVLDDEGKRFLNVIKASSTSLNQHLSDLSDLIGINEKKRIQEFLLDDIVQNVTLELNKKYAIQLVPQVFAEATIKADKLEFKKVIKELFENAIKFNTKIPELKVYAISNTANTTIYIIDNGVGIEAKYHEKVFEIFQRVHPEMNKPGTGNGLAICKKIIETHGGTITISSNEDGGTQVEIQIPLHFN